MAQPDQPAQPAAGTADEAIPLKAALLRARERPPRGPNFGEVDLIPPILDQGDVDKLVEKYGIPYQFETRAAQPGEIACRPSPEFVAIYKDQLIQVSAFLFPSFSFKF